MALYVTRPRRDKVRIGRGLPSGPRPATGVEAVSLITEIESIREFFFRSIYTNQGTDEFVKGKRKVSIVKAKVFSVSSARDFFLQTGIKLIILCHLPALAETTYWDHYQSSIVVGVT